MIGESTFANYLGEFHERTQTGLFRNATNIKNPLKLTHKWYGSHSSNGEYEIRYGGQFLSPDDESISTYVNGLNPTMTIALNQLSRETIPVEYNVDIDIVGNIIARFSLRDIASKNTEVESLYHFFRKDLERMHP